MTTKRKTPKLDQLAEQEQRVIAARAKVDEVKQQARHAEAEAARLRELLTEAFAIDDQTQVEKLTRAKAKADARAVEPWPERVAGSERAVNRVQAEVDAWRAEHVRELLDEIAPDAHAAAEALIGKIDELERARRDWHNVAHRIAALVVGAPGFDPRAIPKIDATDQAIRDLRKGVGPIPPPLPRAIAAATVIPVDDPDPAIREPARQEVRASGEGT